jgi:hypothetical protein
MGVEMFREQLRTALGRTDLRSETVALLADVIAADARFNLAVASRKKRGGDVDLLELSDFYEPLVESCMAEMARFAREKDEGRLAANLESTRDALHTRRKAVDDDRK